MDGPDPDPAEVARLAGVVSVGSARWLDRLSGREFDAAAVEALVDAGSRPSRTAASPELGRGRPALPGPGPALAGAPDARRAGRTGPSELTRLRTP